jgi:glycosyltransferase involved in cell wall biosynthesis
MEHLTVAVIIPTYNRAALVQEAIRSLLAQTQIPDEIIVVDDGSTDNTKEVLGKFEAPVNVITQPNLGRSEARNAGLLAVKSDFIAFLDSDDTLPPNSIAHRAKILEQHPDYDVVYGETLLIDLEGKPVGKFSQFKPGLHPSGLVFAEIALSNLVPLHAIMFRRLCLEPTVCFDPTLDTMEDFDFWLRIAAHHSFVYTDEIVAHYRTHDDMTTVTMPDKMRLSEITVQRRAIEMDVFQKLSPLQQAKIYTTHGAKYAVLGQTKEARKWFTKAILTAPTSMKVSTKAFALMAFTLLGSNGTRYLAAVRRQIRASLKRNTRWAYNRPSTKE